MDESRKHPKGLYALFFTEMWERLAFYTMVGILLLYATDVEKGGLGLDQGAGNEIYGLYLAFVYFTPFLGGMIADRFLGYRRAVIVGAICMATGLFLMSVPGKSFFVMGLVGLIIGNGFFKPNISVMVGNLYEPGDPKRDAGFNIFYMGINIGALVANLLAAAVRNEMGWLWTFRIAGVGLIVSMIILLANWKTLEAADRQPERGPDDASFGDVFGKILGPAAVVGIGGYFLANGVLKPNGLLPPGLRPAVVGFLFGMIPVILFFVRLGNSATPEERPGLKALLPIYVAGGTFFMILHLNGSAMTQWARDTTSREAPAATPDIWAEEALASYYPTATEEVPRPDPRSLIPVSEEKLSRMAGQQRLDEEAVTAILATDPSLRLVQFGATVEADPNQKEAATLADDVGTGEDQSALSDRGVKVFSKGTVTIKEIEDSHGVKSVAVEIPDRAKPRRRVAFVRTIENAPVAALVVHQSLYDELYDGYQKKYGHEPELMKPGVFARAINSEIYQSLNAFFVIAFTPLVVGFWAFMTRRSKQVTTARKLLIGMMMTTGALLFMALAGFLSDGGAERVSWLWLAGFYALVTIGELCLSPMGLSLVTKLTPQRLVGLTMGGWFLATAFGNNLSGFLGGVQGMMDPAPFFLVLAGAAALVALFLRVQLPKLDAVLKQYGA
jgi:dipeptide/tripeptide permease